VVRLGEQFDVDPFAAAAARRRLGHPPGRRRRRRPRTLARKISGVRNFYVYAVDEGHTGTSPVRPRTSPALPGSAANPRPWARTRTNPPRSGRGRARGPRDAAVIARAADQGLRVSELCSVNLEDLSTQRGHRVVGLRRKGGEEQDQAVAPRPPEASTPTWLPAPPKPGERRSRRPAARRTPTHPASPATRSNGIVESCAAPPGSTSASAPTPAHACTRSCWTGRARCATSRCISARQLRHHRTLRPGRPAPGQVPGLRPHPARSA